MVEEPDPERRLRLVARIRGAAPTDPDIGALWRRIQSDFHANQRVIAESLDEKDALRPGLDADTATDILWTLNISNVWHVLVVERGWTPERFEQWIGDLACSQLLERRFKADRPSVDYPG